MWLTTPGPTLGIVGAGQLGRMLGEAAGPLGVETAVLDPTPEPPATPVVGDTTAADFDDEDALRDLAERADVLTYEIELADPGALERVRETTGTPVHPAPETLRTIEDKYRQKEALVDAGVPVPDFRAVGSPGAVRAAGDAFGYPLMVKARRGGYDGRGNAPVEGPDDAGDALCAVAGVDDPAAVDDDDAMVEAFVPFDRELAVMAVRGDGERDAFPVTETIHREEILRETVSPARTTPAVRERAREVALSVLDLLDGRGVFGIELFERDGDVLVNEIAPRPHNSGHWTIEGAHTSQFEQHVRATLGWPLGATDRRCPTALANLLADVDAPRPAALEDADAVLHTDGANLHWYGKREARPLRKMGHVTVVPTGDENVDALLGRAREVRDEVTFA
jgi:5-(carboxyamino)imidazole ribonucleotide synthase